MATLQRMDRIDGADEPQAYQIPTSVFDGSTGPRIIGPRDGKFTDLGSVGVRFMVWGAETGGLFSLVEHPIPPKTLAAPYHRHAREDEYSYVLEGRMGALLGDDVVYAEAGDLVYKPRNQWHTFWNAGDEPCRILEIIAQPGSSTSSTSSATPWQRRTPRTPASCWRTPTSRNATRSSSSRSALRTSARPTGSGSPE